MYRITVHAHHKINRNYNSNQLSSSTIWLLFLLLFKSNIFFGAFQFIALSFKTIEQHSYQVIFTFFYLSSEKNLDAFLGETTERL
jgi:hypothetical protein